jgi:hypothetical protein
MKYLIITVLFCGFILSSCKEKSHVLDLPPNKVIRANQVSDKPFLLSTIADSIYLVPLETSDVSLIKQVDKLYMADTLIFLLDKEGNNKVLVYSQNGKYIESIGTIGNGPEEYASLYDFCVDTISQRLYLLCDKNRIYKYNFEGKILEKFNLDFYAVKIAYNREKLFFIRDEINRPNLIVTDMQGHIRYENFSNAELGANIRILLHPFYLFDSVIFYRTYLNNHIYGIKDDGEIFVQYQFDFGNNVYEIDKNTKSYSHNELNEILNASRGRIKYITENDLYVLFIFFDKKRPVLGVYDKKNDLTDCYWAENLTDDLTGLSFPLIEYAENGNTFIAILNVFELLEYKDPLKNSTYFEDLNLSADDNPILYFIRTK